METKNMISGIVSLAVVVICVAAIMMPVLNDATTTEKTFTNEGIYNYGIFDTTDTYELSASLDTPTVITVDSAEMTNPLGTTNASYSLISSENFLVRMAYNSNTQAYQLTVVGLQSSSTAIRMYMSELTATASEGILTVSGINTSNTEQTATFSYDELYAIVPDEDEAVMKVPTSGAYIKGDTTLYASGLTTVSAWSDMFHFEGTYDDGITITSPNLSNATFDNIVWNIEAVDGYEDLYELTSIEFDIIYNDTTVHATYTYFAVPLEVTAEKSVHFSEGEIALINAIPVLVIVSLVVAAVGMLVVRNRD